MRTSLEVLRRAVEEVVDYHSVAVLVVQVEDSLLIHFESLVRDLVLLLVTELQESLLAQTADGIVAEFV